MVIQLQTTVQKKDLVGAKDTDVAAQGVFWEIMFLRDVRERACRQGGGRKEKQSVPVVSEKIRPRVSGNFQDEVF